MKEKLFVLLLVVGLCCVCDGKRDRVRIRDVETLTLYSDQWTSSRRSSPVKQLTCIGGPCNRAPTHTVQCYNRGFDGNDVQWECKAELPSNYKFGRLEVSCEGYDYPEDDYILVGSCGLEYTIVEASKTSSSYFPSSYTKTYDDSSDSGGSSMLTILMVLGAAVGLYFYLRPSNTQAPTDTGSRTWNTNPSAPPPPPGFRPDFYGTSHTSTTGTSTSSSSSRSDGPGFFSGMAAGSFLGYMFGSNTGTNARRDYQRNSYFNTPSSSQYSSYGGGSTSHSGSKTSESTGFASTKRR